MIMACVFMFLYPYIVPKYPNAGKYLNYFFYSIGLAFIIYIAHLTSLSIDEMAGGKEAVVAFIANPPAGTSSGGLSTNMIVRLYNNASATSDVDILVDIAALTTWFCLCNTCAFLNVVAICVLDAITMTTFVGSLLTCIVAVAVNFFLFELTSGPTNIFICVILLIHVWNIRFTEISARHEFVIAQQQIQKIIEEEEKVQRKNDALEAKLKLTKDQLKVRRGSDEERK